MSADSTGLGHVLLGRPQRLDRLGILTFLRSIAEDRSTMLELRRLLAESLSRSAIFRLRDDAVLEQLAEQYLRGSLSLTIVRPLDVELEGFTVEGAPATAVTDQKNKPEETKPTPEIPPEYPALARVESDKVIDSTSKLNARLDALLFSSFGLAKRVSTIGRELKSVASEQSFATNAMRNALDATLAVQLHAPGAFSKPTPQVKDAYLAAAAEVAPGAKLAVGWLGELLRPLVRVDTDKLRIEDTKAEDDKKDEAEGAEDPRAGYVGFTVQLRSGTKAGPVLLEVVTATGEVRRVTTDEYGSVWIDSLPPGTCDVRSPWEKQPRSNTWNFSQIVSGEISAGGSSIPKDVALLRPKGFGADMLEAGSRQGPSVIAIVERYKVRSGDSLASLAQSVGMSGKELAKFNFGTDKPDEINQALRHIVGCRKKTPDGKNYIFDDADDPGIILLPKPWEAKGLPAEGMHRILVNAPGAPDQKRPRWTFSM